MSSGNVFGPNTSWRVRHLDAQIIVVGAMYVATNMRNRHSYPAFFMMHNGYKSSHYSTICRRMQDLDVNIDNGDSPSCLYQSR